MKKLNTIKTLLATVASLVYFAAFAAETRHFSIPINNQAFDFDHSYTVGSKEYWFETSGAELNQGVALNNTSPRVLMLISQSREGSTPQTFQSNERKLDVSRIQLVSENGQVVDSKKVAESQLAQTGVFSKSVAVFTDKNTPNMGPLKLTTLQVLNSDDKFLVMVREPDSEYILDLSTISQSVAHDRTTLASASFILPKTLERANGIDKPISYLATLIGVDGSRVKVKSQYKDGKLHFLRPTLDNIIAPINGLYELLVEAKGYRNGMMFNRKAKLVLAFSEPTARIVDNVMFAKNIKNAQVRIMVEKYSLFEVRAILYGTNLSGKMVPVMESHVAQELNPGMANLPLKFDPIIIAKAGVSAPFKIDNIRLYDQNQMAMLEEKNTVLTKTLPISKPLFKR